jgi:hypothetical protein
MDDFDRLLETELALMLDRVVRVPAPPRRERPGLRPIVTLHTTPAAAIGAAATVTVLVDLAPVVVVAEVVASPEPIGLAAPVLLT